MLDRMPLSMLSFTHGDEDEFEKLKFSHKTVFVLDHTARMAQSCQQPVEFDAKSGRQGIIPLDPIFKSLYTCNVESVLEYCRIAWDIFPMDKLIRVVISDSISNVINTWEKEDQDYFALLAGFKNTARPDIKAKSSGTLRDGIRMAVQSLAEFTPRQRTLYDHGEDIANRGRIIIMSYLKSDVDATACEAWLLDAIQEENQKAFSSKSLIAIDECELVIVHAYPVTESIVTVKERSKNYGKGGKMMTSQCHCTRSGRYVNAKMMELLQQHYHLTSTTITGIPMKEEQNASSSANYDVEILHPYAAHADLIHTRQMELVSVQSQEDVSYPTASLRWCTPRASSSAESLACLRAFRVSPMDGVSRPSMCLTNFLLSGRQVSLEQMPKSKAGGAFSDSKAVISHVLTANGKEIFIHCLVTARSITEDSPAMSECPGGKVTDYRIPDLGRFTKSHLLFPSRRSDSGGQSKALAILEKSTRHWPMRICDTIIYHLTAHLEPMLSLLKKDKLSDEQLVECKKVIYSLATMDNKGEVLIVPTGTVTKVKGANKREEQYRQIWNELEKYVRFYGNTSEKHYTVLQTLMECRRPGGNIRSPSPIHSPPPIKDKDTHIILECPPESPPQAPKALKRPATSLLQAQPSKMSLYDWYIQEQEEKWEKCHKPFEGSLRAVDGKTELYVDLKVKLENGDSKPNTG